MGRSCWATYSANRRGQGRPAGLLSLWLSRGPTCATKEEHARLKPIMGTASYYDGRVTECTHLVLLAMGHPVVAELLETGRDPFADEGEEPTVVP